MAKCLTLLLAGLWLSGCGFHLRSYNFETEVASYALSGQTRSMVAQPLRRTLKQIGVQETSAADAVLVVELLDQQVDRRSLSTTGQARAAEYELDYRVRYRISDSNNVELLAPVWIERRRTYRISGDNIVGSSEEQALLERELIQDLVGQIVRTMDVASRQLDEPTAEQG